MCVHGFTDTWRTWELVLGALEERHDVLAPTLPGHAGGPALAPGDGAAALADAVERAMDEAGFAQADVVGNSLGGYIALLLAARGRASRAVVFAPAGGWAPGDDSFVTAINPFFRAMLAQVRAAAPHAAELLATDEGRRLATAQTTVRYEHIPTELLVHQLLGTAGCEGAEQLMDRGASDGWELDAAEIGCPLRIVWGTADRVLPWPGAAARYRAELPNADWVILDDVGHLPQLDVPVETAQLILDFTS